MKITLYTITDCPYCKQEKDYLASHNLQYEEKNLEMNKEYLAEMLAVSNNFAGTPVTKIEKDNGAISVLKGFTKEEFDKTLGFAAAPGVSAVAPIIAQQAPPPPTPTQPATEPPIVPQPPITPPEPAQPPVVEPPAAPPAPATSADAGPLQNVINGLSSQVPPSPQPPLPEPPVPPAPQPNPEPVPPQPQSVPSMPNLDGLQTPQQTAQADKLNSVLENLQAKVMNPPAPAIPAAGTMPAIPEPNFN